jgi:hypothetical protein
LPSSIVDKTLNDAINDDVFTVFRALIDKHKNYVISFIQGNKTGKTANKILN